MDSISVTADGKQLAFKKWAGQPSVYVADLQANETRITNPRRLTLSEGVYVPTAWTADSRAVIFDSHRDPVKGRGRELTRFEVDDPKDLYGFDVSPDATRIAVLNFQTGSVHILSLKGQATQEFAVKNWNNGLDWAADGRGVFVSTSTERGSALLHVDLRGNAHVLWEQEGEFVGSYGIPSPDGRHLLMLRSSISSNIWMLENF